MWPNGKIPYTYHNSIAKVPERRASVEEAIRNLEKDSCLQFEDISVTMDDYMKKHTDKYAHNYFHRKDPPPDYPDFIL